MYKGRNLKSINDPGVRPTAAKVKLSFFDIFQEEIRECIFLDGFAGTGNIGIEALSRGADYVVFIEELAEDMKDEAVKIGKMNVDENQATPGNYGIMSIPTLIIFKGGQPAEQVVGVQPKEVLVGKLKSLM